MNKYETALDIYLEELKSDKKNLGAIVTGSYIHGQLDKHSDIDVFIVLHPDCDYRERGNTWINQIEIEYFKNPPQQIRSYFKTEVSPHTAHMLAKGDIRFQGDPVVTELVAEAKQVLLQRPPALKEFQIELARYGLDDLSKDLKDAQLNKDGIGLHLIQAEVINKCIDILMDLRRERRYKNKRLHVQIQEIDPAFLDLLLKTTAEPLSIDATLNLIHYTERLLGGTRPQEWSLRSTLDLR